MVGGTAFILWIHGMLRMTLYTDGQSTTLNLVCKLTPLAKVGKVISPTVCCASPLKPTRIVDFFVISLSWRPIPSRAFLNKMLVELPPSTSTHHSRQLPTVKDMTNPSWCSSSHTSSSSKVIDITSNFLLSGLQDLETLEEVEPSLTSRVAGEYISPQTSDPPELTLITLTWVGDTCGFGLEGFLSKDDFPSSLRRSCRCPLFNMNAMQSSILWLWSWWN